jgi:hypothetical protein
MTLVLSTQECNLYHNINTYKPTIQIQGIEASVYDQKGSYIVAINTKKYNDYEAYSHTNNLPHSITFPPTPTSRFGNRIFLVDTKTHHHNVKETHPIQQPTPHITPEITQLLVDLFNIVHSYYSSPLTCPYNLPHIWDILFGSMGHAQISKQTTSMLAHPTNYNTTLEAIHWVGMEAKEDSNATTILIIYR